jgi:hypothetical protein
MERGIWLTSVLSLNLVNAEAARSPRPEYSGVSRGLKREFLNVVRPLVQTRWYHLAPRVEASFV